MDDGGLHIVLEPEEVFRMGRLMIGKSLAMILMALLLLTHPVWSQVSDDKLIVPGQRIGKWTLDMTIDDLLKMNGARWADGRPGLDRLVGDDVPAENLWVHRWMNLGLVAVTIGDRETQQVSELVVYAFDYKTDKGIGPGSSQEAVVGAYGPPPGVAQHRPSWWTGVYDQIGMAVAREGTYVSVFRAGTARQLYKFP